MNKQELAALAATPGGQITEDQAQAALAALENLGVAAEWAGKDDRGRRMVAYTFQEKEGQLSLGALIQKVLLAQSTTSTPIAAAPPPKPIKKRIGAAPRDLGTNWQAWKDQADIPENINGRWTDLETGIEYDPSYDYTKDQERPSTKWTSLTPKALKARETAKVLGGKALTGTTRQKEWAEKLRTEIIKKAEPSDAEFLISHPVAASAKFWIENRDLSPKKLVKKLIGE